MNTLVLIVAAGGLLPAGMLPRGGAQGVAARAGMDAANQARIAEMKKGECGADYGNLQTGRDRLQAHGRMLPGAGGDYGADQSGDCEPRGGRGRRRSRPGGRANTEISYL